MNQSALEILNHTFGYADFRPQQQEIIERVILGEDVAVLMPTGGGKSLCYQIPAMAREGTGIVVSPLIALMEDQVSALRQLGIRAAYLNSTLNAETARQVEQQLLKGELDLLYVAPERLTTERFLHLLDQALIALFAIDEAHCVSQWGHDFRPDYIQLSILHERYPDVPRMALTATADEVTRKEILQRLALQNAKLFVAGFDRPNICYRILQNTGHAREDLLRFIKSEHADHAGIVYCLSRKKVESTAQWLKSQGFTALPYHAGLSADVRRQNQRCFLNDDAVIMVATIAFGMGIDKPDVRFVAHLNLPKSVEAYYQETGRAGRDGRPADAWMMVGLQDVIMLKKMMQSSEADEMHKRVEHHKLDSMLGLTELISCRRQALLRYFGDVLDKPCGNCDTCLTPVETWDATEEAQKALSCVHRTGQRFGVNYLIEVLRQSHSERIKQFGHHKLSVYGIGVELEPTQWRSIFRQLIAQGFLVVDVAGYGNLQLTEKCRPILRGEQKLMLRRERKVAQPRRAGGKRINSERHSSSELWDALRNCRKQLAEKLSVPPYVIFHDATLMEMVEHQPKTIEQFSRLSGVGDVKLKRYADAFLKVIAEHTITGERAAPPADSIYETIQCFRAGMHVDAIAQQRKIKIMTVYNHLSHAIAQGEIRLQDVVKLESEEITSIQDALLASEDGGIKLKPVYESLGGMFEYHILGCVRASLKLD
jgi:ATP-dependent DNA helicase RecQ